jgi:hypothetical protein
MHTISEVSAVYHLSQIFTHQLLSCYKTSGARNFVLLNEEVVSRFICPRIVPHNILSRETLTPYPFLFETTRPSPLEATQTRYRNSENLWVTTRESLESKLASAYDSFKYIWSSRNFSYLTRDIFRRCTKKRAIYALGSSHTRGLYDFYYHNYINSNQYLRHIDHQYSPSYAHKHLVFARWLADGIDKLTCDRKMSVIIEVGSWGLFFPLQNFIFNPKDGPKLIRSISNLMKRSKCRENVNLLITTCPSVPLCKDHDCGRVVNYWRNNAVIRALNQYLMVETMKLNLSTSSVKILDVMPFMLPRTLKWKKEFVSTDHYLSSGYATTPHGIAFATETLFEVCRDVIEEMASSSDPKKLSKLGFTKPEVSFAVSSGASIAYYIWHVNVGCYEHFPDIDSLKSYGYHPEQFTMVNHSHDIIQQYVPCKASFPLNGLIWQLPRDKSLYFIDSGFRRPIFNAQAMFSLGRKFSEAREVTQEKMFSFPEGQTLYDRSDVNYMKHSS